MSKQKTPEQKARAADRKAVSKQRTNVLVYIAETGDTSAEAARKFGLKPSTVRSWVNRAREGIQAGVASPEERAAAEKQRKKGKGGTRLTGKGAPALRGTVGGLPASDYVLDRLRKGTKRILDFVDSDAVILDGRQTRALTGALVDLVKICPELVQLHREDVEGGGLDDEAERLARALGLTVEDQT